MSGCPDRPHVHHHAAPGVLIFRGWSIALDHHDDRTILLCNDEHVAERVAELLDRHGLIDVPDTPAAACPWPPPNPGGV